jgi:hypothetical protein
VPVNEIPPYTWLEKTLADLGLKKIADVTGMRERFVERLAKGGTIDEVFDILGKKTRWKVLGAIYGLIQASLKYFLKSSEVLKGIGFMQCPFDMAVFCKWFPNGRVSIFWQHVDDRWGGFSTEEEMPETLKLLHEQLGSQQESTAMVLGHDNEYDRLKGVMRCGDAPRKFMLSWHLSR